MDFDREWNDGIQAASLFMSMQPELMRRKKDGKIIVSTIVSVLAIGTPGATKFSATIYRPEARAVAFRFLNGLD